MYYLPYRVQLKSYLNPIQPGMIWTVNYLGGGVYVTPPPVYLDNYATYRYEKLHTNKKKCFLSRYKIRFFMFPL